MPLNFVLSFFLVYLKLSILAVEFCNALTVHGYIHFKFLQFTDSLSVNQPIQIHLQRKYEDIWCIGWIRIRALTIPEATIHLKTSDFDDEYEERGEHSILVSAHGD